MNPAHEEPFEELAWDSRHFGLKIGRVAHDKAEIAKSAVQRATCGGLDCLYLLLDSQDAPGLRSAADAGFRMVDIRVALSAEIPPAGDRPGIRRAISGDIQYLSGLAARSHRNSRFYADGRFPRDRCDALFAAWIERSCTDPNLAGAVFVADAAGEPAGYVTCAIKQGVGDIGLFAVDERHTGRGLGSALLGQSYAWFRAQGASRVQVVTQGSNVRALRVYERSGFRVETVQLWFHWWRPSR